jgi:hypothetical protein
VVARAQAARFVLFSASSFALTSYVFSPQAAIAPPGNPGRNESTGTI